MPQTVCLGSVRGGKFILSHKIKGCVLGICIVYVIIIMLSLVTGLFFLVLLLNQL